MPTAISPPASDQKPQSIAIIGGGIGGLCLAIGFLKHNVPFHMYEAAPQFTEIGLGVGLGINARRSMTLIDPRIKKGYDKHATTNHDDFAKPLFFQFQMGMDARESGNQDYQPGGEKKHKPKAGDAIFAPGGPGKGINMIHRARFLEELVKLVPEDCVTFGKKLTNVEEYDGGVRFEFADGTSENASALIGCDGIKSKVRRSLYGREYDPTFSGKYAYRGILPMDKAIGLLGEKMARNSQGWMGYGGHVLTMPVERGAALNIQAVHTSPDGQWHDPRWVIPMTDEDKNRDFGNWCREVQGILSLMENPDRWGMFDHGRPIPQLWQGRVCLMGDAAHASTPFQGGGAGMAIEDAYVLSGLLGRIRGSDEIPHVFEAYNHVRYPRDIKLMTTSRQAGDIYEFLDPNLGDDVEKIAENLTHRYDWIWDEDVEAELPQALKHFESVRKGRGTATKTTSVGLISEYA